jgi:hypothetical protein
MARQILLHCEREDCVNHVLTGRDVQYSLPPGWIVVREGCDGHDDEYDFCSWNCLMVYSASVPRPEEMYVVIDQEHRDDSSPDEPV